VDFVLSIEILAQNHRIFRDAETSFQQNFALVFLFIFFAKNMKSGVPAALGRVVKAELESHPQISCTNAGLSQVTLSRTGPCHERGFVVHVNVAVF